MSETYETVTGELPVDAGARQFPDEFESIPRWLFWMPEGDDSRKIPRAPWNNPAWPEKFVSAHDPANWLSFDDFQAYDRMYPDHVGFRPAFSIPPRDADLDGEAAALRELVLVDFDDVIDPDAGELHPRLAEFLAPLETYGQISTSQTGLHAIGEGQLPDGIRSVKIDLATEEWPDAEIEIYDAGRFIAMTGRHIAQTPTSIEPVGDVVEAWADEYVAVPEAGAYDDRVERAPKYDEKQLESMEQTTDVEAVYDAIDAMAHDPYKLKSTETNHRSNGKIDMNPSWANSKSGTRLACVDPALGKYWYRDGDIGLSLFQVVALEEGIIARETDYPTGAKWWRTIEACRERGWHIPELIDNEADQYGGDYELVPTVSPTGPQRRIAGGEWDWTAAATKYESGILEHVYDRTRTTLERAISGVQNQLVESLPATGKTTNTIKACANTDEPITFLTGRGNEEQYAKVSTDAEEHGLDALVLPSFVRHCPCACGEHGESVQNAIMACYNRGITPKDLHVQWGQHFDWELPCTADGECPYMAMWSFDPDEYDILIGHYNHAHQPRTITGRTVVIDEFPGQSYEFTRGPDAVVDIATSWLADSPDIDLENFADLMEERNHDNIDWTRAMLPFLTGVEDDPEHAFREHTSHALAPAIVYTLLASGQNTKFFPSAPGGPMGNDLERATFPGDDDRVGLYDRQNGAVRVMNPPDFTYATNVVALDGTPTKGMWEDCLQLHLESVRVLNDEEQRHFITDGLGLEIVVTTDAVKPYHARDGRNVNLKQDAALLERIHDAYGRKPALISTARALDTYDADSDILEKHVSKRGYYGNMLGSNEFAEERLGCVIGSSNYGDGFVKTWAAYRGEAVERGEGTGTELSFGPYGDQVLTHMREHRTLQAVMRFGRDGDGAVVYVHTNTLPDAIPHTREAVVETWNAGQKQVIRAARELDGEFRTHTVASHDAVEIGERHVRNCLHDLAQRGYIDKRWEGKGYEWTADGLAEVGEYGDLRRPVTIDAVEDTHGLSVAEIERNTYYWWKFRTPGRSDSAELSPDEAVAEETRRPKSHPPPD